MLLKIDLAHNRAKSSELKLGLVDESKFRPLPGIQRPQFASDL
jgi:hypothetical protein